MDGGGIQVGSKGKMFILRTSMTLGWLSSRRYLTSRIADMSRPSLNCPTLIFLMATRRPVDFSRAETTMDKGQVEERKRGGSDRPLYTTAYVPSPSGRKSSIAAYRKTHNRAQKRTNLGLL